MKKRRFILLLSLVLLFCLQCNIATAADYKDVRIGMFTKFKAYDYTPQLDLSYFIIPSSFGKDVDNKLNDAAKAWNKQVPGLQLLPADSKENADITLYLSDSYLRNDSQEQAAGECNLYDEYGMCVNNDAKDPDVSNQAINYSKAECIVFMKSPSVRSNTRDEYVQVMMHEIGHSLGLSDLSLDDPNYWNVYPRPVMMCGIGQSPFLYPGADGKRATSPQPTDIKNINKRWQQLAYTEKKYIRADFNKDGAVNMTDIMLIAKYFNQKTSSDSAIENKYDVNNDHVINMQDAMMVGQFFGKKLN